MHFLHFVGLTAALTASLLILALLLHLFPKLGSVGRSFSDFLCHAPALDLIIACFTVGPLIAGPICMGWRGFLAGVISQIAAALIWVFVNEYIHRQETTGPRIVKVINRIVGPWRNHAALWMTAIVAPFFTVARLMELTVYPMLTLLIGLPSQKQREWVNVSRHKFSGLVGHDLIWCLYCDWMTGVVSLATEMLRNVESFWCPIRFASGKKCANCCVDFPDINQGWIDAGGTMEQVTAKLEQMYSGSDRSFFAKRVPITINGNPTPDVPG
jgi:hypothetical protein